jgi:6-phosphogluconolactonase/glucosamine-6-phosphate isomerase/deaminase
MRFIRTDSADVVAGFMAGLVQGYLDQGRRVLWLLSGGSGIAAAVAAWKLLDTATGHLVIGQIDERYGAVGHADSNWQQLTAAGLAPRAGEQTLPMLTGAPMGETVAAYTGVMKQELERADVRVGFLGMGADGHTAGILPHSSAVESPALVADYQADDYQRITVTAAVISRLDEAIVLANGAAKREQLQRLQAEVPAADQPAQLLKQAGHTTVFSDVA